MAVNEKNLTVSQLIDDLNNGLTWLKKDDLGYGSIETKYGANEKQILAIRKHPKLKDAETCITIFNIIDDTVNESNSITKESTSAKSASTIEQPVDYNNTTMGADQDAADIFANL